MDIRTLAKALGGDVAGRNNVLCPGPGHSPRDRSLSVTFTTGDDFTVFSHAGDDWRACKDHVRHRLGLDGSTVPERNSARSFSRLEKASGALGFGSTCPKSDLTGHLPSDRTARAISLWHDARPIGGTPAAVYLASRGVAYQGKALRWHPSCPFGKGVRYGCMIALVRNIITNEPQAIHRTALDADGHKIDRKAFGPVGGGAVKLTDDADVSRVIAIGEGIETALSIRELPDLSNLPIWSVLSANGISTFPALPGIESVWIAADNDLSGTGQNAARVAGERLHAAGIEVIILASTQAGADLNDKVAHHA